MAKEQDELVDEVAQKLYDQYRDVDGKYVKSRPLDKAINHNMWKAMSLRAYGIIPIIRKKFKEDCEACKDGFISTHEKATSEVRKAVESNCLRQQPVSDKIFSRADLVEARKAVAGEIKHICSDCKFEGTTCDMAGDFIESEDVIEMKKHGMDFIIKVIKCPEYEQSEGGK